MICPSCGSWVDEGDPVCSSCGAYFSDDDCEEYECPQCHEHFEIDEFDTNCRFCGAPIKREDYFY